jgi:ParB family chromosome partitioning protein
MALSTELGLKVTIAGSGERGELRIAYRTLEQLDALCRRLGPA